MLSADYQKGLEKIVLEREKESMRSVPDWSIRSRIVRRGQGLAKGNKSVAAIGLSNHLHSENTP